MIPGAKLDDELDDKQDDKPDVSQQRVAILTRPAGQSAGVCDALSRLGMPSLDFPLIDIQPITDHAPLDAALDTVDRFSLLFFVSPNAIDQVFARAMVRGMDLKTSLVNRRDEPIIAVVGPGSVRALAAYGITPATHRIVAPKGAIVESPAESPAELSPADAIRYDSEALWRALNAEVDAAWLAGRPALILRGDGGREWFADALRSAGMDVQTVAAYRRGVPNADAAMWQQVDSLIDSRQAVWVLSSSEGVRNLEMLAFARYVAGRAARHEAPDPRYAALKRCAVIVPHHRIAEAASRAGFDTITICGGGDANLLRAIRGVQNEYARIANENGKPYA